MNLITAIVSSRRIRHAQTSIKMKMRLRPSCLSSDSSGATVADSAFVDDAGVGDADDGALSTAMLSGFEFDGVVWTGSLVSSASSVSRSDDGLFGFGSFVCRDVVRPVRPVGLCPGPWRPAAGPRRGPRLPASGSTV